MAMAGLEFNTFYATDDALPPYHDILRIKCVIIRITGDRQEVFEIATWYRGAWVELGDSKPVLAWMVPNSGPISLGEAKEDTPE